MSKSDNMSTSTSRVDSKSMWDENETTTSKFWRKSKKAPFVPIGLAGLVGACIYGARAYKNRGGMSTSVYLMQYRVIAQGMVVGCITLGIGVSIAQKIFNKDKPDS